MAQLIINLYILQFGTLVIILLFKTQYNILLMFLYLEIIYITVLCLFNSLNFWNHSASFSILFIYLIAISSVKSIIGLCFLINYVRVYNTIYL